MKINLATKTVQSVALAGITLLTVSSIPLLADNPSSKPTSDSNAVPCLNHSQGDGQHQQWMAQQGSMMGQEWHGSGGWGHHSQYGRMYDPNNLATIRGEVVSVNTFTPREGIYGGMHLQLKNEF